MKESLHDYMKLGIVHFMAFPATMRGEGPVLETIEKVATDADFDVIEITWIKDAAVREQARKLLEASHLHVCYGAQPRLLTTGMNINDLDEAKRTQAVATLKEGIDEAYEMGARGFAFLSGKYEEATKEQSCAALLDSTRQLCAYAQGKGDLPVLLEVFDYDIDKKSLIGPTPLAKRFAEEVTKEFDNFGLMVDLSHIPMQHETCTDAILPVVPYIRHAHMGNTVIRDPQHPAYGDSHPRFGMEDSENDVPQLTEYLRMLLEVGYLNRENPPVLSFEVKPWGDEKSEVVIANAKRTLRAAWAQVKQED